MTAHELAKRLLAVDDAPIETWDPDSESWEQVTGFTYGAGLPVQLYTDSDEEVELTDPSQEKA